MKRIMLAAGPWMLEGTDIASRIVCYGSTHKLGELVVHRQYYNAADGQDRRISFETGNYFPNDQLPDAMKRWEDRNWQNCNGRRYAGSLLATEASTASDQDS